MEWLASLRDAGKNSIGRRTGGIVADSSTTG
jgi:hypothetical protein